MITCAGMLKTTTGLINPERRFESCCLHHSNKREVNRWSMSVYHIQARFARTSAELETGYVEVSLIGKARHC